MNVYDFDQTIFDGDSTLLFYLFCLRKHPTLLHEFPGQFQAFIKYKMGKIEKREFKEKFYCFLKKVPDIKTAVNDFWDEKQYRIKEWYKVRQRKDDLIISASPEFLLEEICRRLSIVNLIASKVDQNTGKFLSENCYGKEKVNRFLKEFPETELKEFYSDSYSDEPMAVLAKDAFIVKGSKIMRW